MQSLTNEELRVRNRQNKLDLWPWSICHIKEPTLIEQAIAVRRHPAVLFQLKNISPDLLAYAKKQKRLWVKVEALLEEVRKENRAKEQLQKAPWGILDLIKPTMYSHK